MELTASPVRQLQQLDGDERLGPGLARLAAGLATAVPSLRTVSLLVVHHSVPVTITVRSEAGAGAAVLASLAVELTGEAGSLLILQAGEQGAFLLLQHELAALPLSHGPTPQVHRHRAVPGHPDRH